MADRVQDTFGCVGSLSPVGQPAHGSSLSPAWLLAVANSSSIMPKKRPYGLTEDDQFKLQWRRISWQGRLAVRDEWWQVA